jgi:hypothetical protein
LEPLGGRRACHCQVEDRGVGGVAKRLGQGVNGGWSQAEEVPNTNN